MIPRAECERRVSGMQSKMDRQIVALRKEYDEKIQDFTNQLNIRNEELTKVQAEVTSLNSELESTKKSNAELSQKISALDASLAEKTQALATRNASVLTPGKATATDWRQLKGKEFFEFLRAHPEIKNSNTHNLT